VRRATCFSKSRCSRLIVTRSLREVTLLPPAEPDSSMISTTSRVRGSTMAISS